jgi:hypothetical protein
MSGRINRHLVLGGWLFFGLAVYGISYPSLLSLHQDVSRSETSGEGIWNLPPAVILAIAGEFKGLVADYLTLEAGAQLGTELKRRADGSFEVVVKDHNWQSIYKLFLASQALDPSFGQTYLLMQAHLPWEPAHMVEEALAFLAITAENRPWDYQVFQAMGFNNYFFLNRPKEAGTFYLKAAQVPGAPPLFALLGARLSQQGGDTETAIVAIQSMLAGKNETDYGYIDMNERLVALQGVLQIENAVAAFAARFHKRPASLAELRDSGFLEQVPVNPYNTDYCIDLEGRVFFDQVNCDTNGD